MRANAVFLQKKKKKRKKEEKDILIYCLTKLSYVMLYLHARDLGDCSECAPAAANVDHDSDSLAWNTFLCCSGLICVFHSHCGIPAQIHTQLQVCVGSQCWWRISNLLVLLFSWSAFQASVRQSLSRDQSRRSRTFIVFWMRGRMTSAWNALLLSTVLQAHLQLLRSKGQHGPNDCS